MAESTSGTWSWQPDLAAIVRTAYARNQIYAPALEDQHLIDARECLNLIFVDWANRGINLWTVDQIAFALEPDQTTYVLPRNTVNLLDCYLREYVPPGDPVDLGNPLVALMTGAGDPMLTALGEPMVLQPSSGVFTIVQGSRRVVMNWPNHRFEVGMPIEFSTTVTAGPMTLPLRIVVSEIVDQNNIAFWAPKPAPVSEIETGGTPLFVSDSGSSVVTVVLAGHGLIPGEIFTVHVATTVGGITLAPGAYPVQGMPHPAYDFTIDAGMSATSSTIAFEKGGVIGVATTPRGTIFTDTLLWPISRNEYAAQPNKTSRGRPSVYWFDRLDPPVLNPWQVPPPNSRWSFVGFRMRDIEDALPTMGQAAEVPRRFLPVLFAELTAGVAEIYRPERYQEKLEIAAMLWERASNEDREKVVTRIVPQLQSYYRR